MGKLRDRLGVRIKSRNKPERKKRSKSARWSGWLALAFSLCFAFFFLFFFFLFFFFLSPWLGMKEKTHAWKFLVVLNKPWR